MAPDDVTRCPTPQKKAYESRQVAGFFANTDGLRPYQCPCGKWHLSSKRVTRRKPVTAR